MNKTTMILALALLLPLGAARASGLDDLTMQVMDSNDPSASISDMALPAFDSPSADTHKARSEDAHDEATHMASDSRSDIESSVDDSKNDLQDTVSDSHDEAQSAVDDSRDEIKDQIEDSKDSDQHH